MLPSDCIMKDCYEKSLHWMYEKNTSLSLVPIYR